MAKTKTRVKKKGTTSPLKPNIFSIQIFPPLRTTTKPNNHSKQVVYTKRSIPNPQTSIHTKIHTKNPYKIPTKVPNKFHTRIHRKPYKSIPLISCLLPSSFFLLLFSSSSSSPSLLFSLIRFCYLPKTKK